MVVHDLGRVAGYYAIAATSIEPRLLPRAVRTGQPPNPIPCLLIGQLAVDLDYRGIGLGGALVTHALARAVASADLTAGRAVLVNAIDEVAAAFWRTQGFVGVPDDSARLFRSMDDIRASLPGSR